MAGPEMSVCVLTRRVSPALGRCLDSLRAQETSASFEVLVASDGDPAVASFVHGRFPEARVGLVRGEHPGGARNHLVRDARGELLWFLDDDVVLPPDVLQRLVDAARAHPEIGVFGGPNLTPPGSTFFEKVEGAVLASILGSGPVRRRYRRHSSGPADDRFLILCNLVVRRDAMLPFPPELMGGEENALLGELRRRQLPMVYDEDFAVWHERRPTLRSFATQMRKYGRGRGQAIRRHATAFRSSYLLPTGLLVYLASLPAALWITPWLLAPFGVYAAAVGAQGAKIGVGKRSVRAGALATLLVVVVHLAYGAGVLQGLFRKAQRPTAGDELQFLPLPLDGV